MCSEPIVRFVNKKEFPWVAMELSASRGQESYEPYDEDCQARNDHYQSTCFQKGTDWIEHDSEACFQSVNPFPWCPTVVINDVVFGMIATEADHEEQCAHQDQDDSKPLEREVGKVVHVRNEPGLRVRYRHLILYKFIAISQVFSLLIFSCTIVRMRQSFLFTKTRKEAPKDEVAQNAKLLIRAGFIHKELAGVYSYLPLGLRVMEKIVNVIREEMNVIGGQEVTLTALQDKKVWEISGRWDDSVLDVWFKTKLKNDTELGLGTTHEEQLTALMKDYIASYRDLPRYVYQFQTKFRNETRAKSGIMRGREFVMKDLYSFSADQESHDAFYEKVKQAYSRIFARLGLGDRTYVTFASGGSFSKYSHEFQTLFESGEDIIYIDKGQGIAINKEVYNSDSLSTEEANNLASVGIEAVNLKGPFKAIEVGNIFSLGTRFSDAFDLNFIAQDGSKKPVIMGSYGIGPGRVMGTIAEVLSDKDGLVWPEVVAPFKLHLIALFDKEGKVKICTDALYQKLTEQGVEVLYDDRDQRAGEKFADADLVGIPYRAIVSDKTLAEKVVEFKNRKTGEVSKISEEDLFKILAKKAD